MLTLRAVGDLVFALDAPDWDDPGFAPLHSLLTQANLSFGNLESPLTDRGIPACKFDITRSNRAAAKTLKRLGIGACSIANNHMMDYGLVGLQQTTEALREQDIAFSGAGGDINDAFAPVIREVDGQRVAFVSFFAFCFPGQERYCDQLAAEEGPGVATIRSFLVRMPEGPTDRSIAAPEERVLKVLLDSVRRAREQADIVVVSMHSHFGLECANEVAPARHLMARLAVDAGADLVLGHGPHTTNGIEFYKGAFIAHSLGNFYFHYPRQVVTYNYPESAGYVGQYLADSIYWEGLVLEAVFDGGRPEEIYAVPVSIDHQEKPYQGMPCIGDEVLARKMGARMAEQSLGMGVKVEVDGARLRFTPE